MCNNALSNLLSFREEISLVENEWAGSMGSGTFSKDFPKTQASTPQLKMFLLLAEREAF